MAVAQLVCVCVCTCVCVVCVCVRKCVVCACMRACMHTKSLVAVVKLVRDEDSWIQGHAGGPTAFNNTVYTHIYVRAYVTEFH